MTEELKPCPFCGGEAELFVREVLSKPEPLNEVWTAKCINEDCKADEVVVRGHTTAKGVTKAWNTRAPDPDAEALAEAGKAVRLSYNDTEVNAEQRQAWQAWDIALTTFRKKQGEAND